jgi:hypothetical protein
MIKHVIVKAKQITLKGYKLSLCHTPIKPDLLGFLGIGVFA